MCDSIAASTQIALFTMYANDGRILTAKITVIWTYLLTVISTEYANSTSARWAMSTGSSIVPRTGAACFGAVRYSIWWERRFLRSAAIIQKHMFCPMLIRTEYWRRNADGKFSHVSFSPSYYTVAQKNRTFGCWVKNVSNISEASAGTRSRCVGISNDNFITKLLPSLMV